VVGDRASSSVHVREEFLDAPIEHPIVVLEVPPVELVELSGLTLGEVDDRLLDAQWQSQLNVPAIRRTMLIRGLEARLRRA
jgi:hypothetical protein